MDGSASFAVGEVAQLVAANSSRNGTQVTVVRILGSNRYAVQGGSDAMRSTVVSGDCLRKLADPPHPEKPAGLPQPGHYTIVGTWDNWDGQEMGWNGPEQCFEFIVMLRSAGSESFKILADGDWDKCVYPDCPDANPYEMHNLLGPDPCSTDADWTIGLHHKDGASEGKRYKVRLRVSGDGHPKSVDWEATEAAQADGGSAAQQPRAQDRQPAPKRASVRDLLKRAPGAGSLPRKTAPLPDAPEPLEWWMVPRRSAKGGEAAEAAAPAAAPTAGAAKTGRQAFSALAPATRQGAPTQKAADGPQDASKVAPESLKSLLCRARPGFPTREFDKVESKLQQIGISTVGELAASFQRGDTNQLLTGAELSTLGPSWMQALAPLMEAVSSSQEGAPPQEPQPPSVPQAKADTKAAKPPPKKRWEIVGGTNTNGILVRSDHDVKSPVLAARIETGAIVEELDLMGQRLHFNKVSGNGPQEGWILIALKDKELARPVVEKEEPADVVPESKEPAAPAAPAAPVVHAPGQIRATQAAPKQVEISADLRQRAKKLNIHLAQLENHTPEHLAELFDSLDRVHKSTATKLQAQYTQMGFAMDDDDPMERAEMSRLMHEALIWQEMNLANLQEACSLKGILVELDQPREELLKLLANNTWESAGIPVTRLPDLDVARHLLKQFNGLVNASLNWLSMECEHLELPHMQSQEAMVSLLKQAYIWKVLPVPELCRECRAHGITPNVQDIEDASAQEELQQQLRTCLRGNRCEARGIPVKRLGSMQLASQLLDEVDKLQVMGPMSLKSEYKRMCLTFDGSLDMQVLVDRLRDQLIWDNLPLPLLQSECRQRGLVHNDGRNAMVKRLSQRLDYELELERQGLPVRRLGYTVAMEVLNQFEEINILGLEDLVEWYKGTGFPDDNTLTREALVNLVKDVAVWEALPLQELGHVAAEKKLPLQESPQFSSDNEHREFLITKLLQQQHMEDWKDHFQSHCIGDFQAVSRIVQRYSDFQNMSDEDLNRSYAERGLPRMAKADRAATLEALKMMMIWDALPLLELQVECLERSDKIQCDFENKGNEEEQRSSLIQQLTVEMLKSAYEELGVPVESIGYLTAYKVGGELVSFTTMEVQELTEKCNALALPVTPDMTSSEMRSQLVSTTLWKVQPADQLFKELQKRGLQGTLRDRMQHMLLNSIQHA